MNSDAAATERANLSRFVLVITSLLVLGMALRSPLDSDLWWHLRAGEETLQAGQPLLVDSFSYTRGGEAWHNHSWLGQVLLALIYRAAGLPGLSWLVALLATGSLLLVYRQLHAAPLIRAFSIALAATVTAPVWVARPQIFSLFLFAVTMHLLCAWASNERTRLWLLIPLFVLWSNLHAGYILGLMLIGVHVFGEAANHLFSGTGEDMPWRKIATLAGWGAAAGLATIVNPNGIHTWLVQIQTVRVSALQAFIVEWASPDFHDISQQPMLWLLLATFGLMTLNKARARVSQVLEVIFFAGLALIARRNFGPFGLVTVPIFAEQVSSVFTELYERYLRRWKNPQNAHSKLPQSRTGWKKAINLMLAALIWLLVLLKGYFASHPVMTGMQIDNQYPVRAVEYLKAQRPPGNLLNAYNWGGYLIWALPEYPVFVDGRTDLYGDALLSEWMELVQAEGDWQTALDARGVRLVLLEPERALTKLLPLHGWKLLVDEDGYVLYGR